MCSVLDPNLFPRLRSRQWHQNSLVPTKLPYLWTSLPGASLRTSISLNTTSPCECFADDTACSVTVFLKLLCGSIVPLLFGNFRRPVFGTILTLSHRVRFGMEGSPTLDAATAFSGSSRQDIADLIQQRSNVQVNVLSVGIPMWISDDLIPFCWEFCTAEKWSFGYLL